MTKRDSKINAILDAATELMGQYGYYGTSLERIGELTGMSKQNLLYYVSNKQNLMVMLLDERYDHSREIEQYQRHFAAMGDDEQADDPPLIPAHYRYMAQINETRPAYVRLFSMLGAESVNPAHPAHAYFNRREDTAFAMESTIRWKLPDGVDFATITRTCRAAMDGVQLRWLRTPGASLVDMWKACEPALFPSPLWDGYK